MKYFAYGVLVLLLMDGCVRHVRHIPIESLVDQNDTNTTGALYDTTQVEEKYNLKPEPYSIGSKAKDPELLEPQRISKNHDQSTRTAVSHPARTSNFSGVTKSECISMIGQEKFDRFSKRFGGEASTIKRCAILKKLKRG